MNPNELNNRIERLEKQVFGMTYQQEKEFQIRDKLSDYVIAKIIWLIRQYNPELPRYDYHLGLIQVEFGLDDLSWSHVLNVKDSIDRGVRPDFSKEFYPRVE